MRPATILIALGILAMGCSSAVSSPASRVASAPAWQVTLGPEYLVTISDRSGEVLDAAPSDLLPEEVVGDGPFLEPGAGSPSLRVGWLSSECEHSPTVVVSRGASGLQIDVYFGPVPATDVPCSDVGVPRAVMLSLSAAPADVNGSVQSGEPTG